MEKGGGFGGKTKDFVAGFKVCLAVINGAETISFIKIIYFKNSRSVLIKH